MTRKRNYLRISLRVIAGLSAATVFGQFAGCRESVITAFYTGLENLAVSMVEAYFEAITPTFSTSASLILGPFQGWLA